MTSGKGSTANFVWRCGLCKRESSAKFEPGEKPKPYTADSNGQFAPFLTIDCRGLEFTGFDPKASLLLIYCDQPTDLVNAGHLEMCWHGVGNTFHGRRSRGGRMGRL